MRTLRLAAEVRRAITTRGIAAEDAFAKRGGAGEDGEGGESGSGGGEGGSSSPQSTALSLSLSLSLSAFEKAVLALSLPGRITSKQMKDLFDYVDKDDDGSVSLDEWKAEFFLTVRS